jgi:hypothetical protein
VDASPSTRRVAAIAAAALVGALAIAGCGDDGEEPGIPQSGERITTTSQATTTTSPASDTTEVGEGGEGGEGEGGGGEGGDGGEAPTTAAGEG